jgi:hypothetical protein
MDHQAYIAEHRQKLRETMDALQAQMDRNRMEMRALQEAAQRTVGALEELARWEQRIGGVPGKEARP